VKAAAEVTGRRLHTMEAKLTARRILFIGRVQGVGFRYAAREIAEREGLTGFVRNLADGTVEMLAQGRPAQIDLCLEQIALEFGDHIRGRRIEQVPPDPQYTDFCIAF
jgi:acylphosphatase